MGADGKRELMPKGEHEEVELETAAEAAAPLASTTPWARTTASFTAMDELWEQARLELEEMLFATPPVKGSADSGAFYSTSNQICATPLRDATPGSLCAPLGSPASPVTCPADEHTLMDNNMDGAGDDDDTESPDTRDDCDDSASLPELALSSDSDDGEDDDERSPRQMTVVKSSVAPPLNEATLTSGDTCSIAPFVDSLPSAWVT